MARYIVMKNSNGKIENHSMENYDEYFEYLESEGVYDPDEDIIAKEYKVGEAIYLCFKFEDVSGIDSLIDYIDNERIQVYKITGHSYVDEGNDEYYATSDFRIFKWNKVNHRIEELNVKERDDRISRRVSIKSKWFSVENIVVNKGRLDIDPNNI